MAIYVFRVRMTGPAGVLAAVRSRFDRQADAVLVGSSEGGLAEYMGFVTAELGDLCPADARRWFLVSQDAGDWEVVRSRGRPKGKSRPLFAARRGLGLKRSAHTMGSSPRHERQLPPSRARATIPFLRAGLR